MDRCTHEKSYWTTTYYIDDWTGERCANHEHVTESSLVDIDLHRYQCTECDEIFYYSGCARKAYEDNDIEAKVFLDIK